MPCKGYTSYGPFGHMQEDYSAPLEKSPNGIVRIGLMPPVKQAGLKT
jgi:hypothetical protein